MEERVEQCIDTVLFGKVCDYCDGGAIYKVLGECVEILTILIGALAVIGITIIGIKYITSAGDTAKQTKAKRHLAEIIIGLFCYGLFVALLEFIIPGGVINSTLDTTTTSCPAPVEEPVAPIPPVIPSDPTNPPGNSVACAQNPNTVESGGICYAKTAILATDYVKDACSKYHSCQDYKPDEWGNKCEAFARINAKEMMYGTPFVHEVPGGGAIAHTLTIPSSDGEDNSPIYCRGSVSKNSSSKVVNRTAFKKFVKELVTEILSGKPVTVAMANKTLGKGNSSMHWNRHFVTMVGVSSFVSTTNIDQIEVYFEDGSCIDGGDGITEPYDQPHIILNDQEVQFAYVDPWGADLHITGTKGNSRAWRFHYETGGWYMFKY